MRSWRSGAIAVLCGFVLASGTFAGHVSARVGADMNVTITASRHVVQPFRNITFVITGTNVGDTAAQNVVVSGWLPDWFNYVGSSCTGSGVSVTQLGALACGPTVDLAPGSSVTLRLVLTTFNNPRQDRNGAYELGFVDWGPDVTSPQEAMAQVKIQIAGRPGEAQPH